MDEMHNYATPSTSAKIPNINQNQQKRRVKVSDDIQIIIKKFRDNSEGDRDDNDDYDYENIEESIQQKEEKKNLKEEAQRRHTENSKNLKAILEKLTNIESLLKVIAEQGTLNLNTATDTIETNNQLQSIVQKVPIVFENHHRYHFTNKDNIITALNTATNTSNIFDFPIKHVEALIELQEQLSENEELAEKMMKYLKKTKFKYDENLGKALTSLVTDEVLFNMNWDGSKGKIQISSLDLFSNFLYNAWAKDKMNYEQYSIEIKKQLKLSHNRMCKRRSRALSKTESSTGNYDTEVVNVDF